MSSLFAQEACMGVWSPAFQHQFLDGNLLNFSAAPGADPDIAFEAPIVRPPPPPNARGFPVRPGNRFTYTFEPGLFGNVIGADIKLDIAFPPAATGQTSGTVVLGNDTIRLLLGFINGNARIQLVVNGHFLAAVDQFDPAAPLRIHARWHTHGPGQISVNGNLRSYDPALVQGAKFTIERLAFGHHSLTPSAPSVPAFVIRRIAVKLLRDDDSARCLDRLFPLTDAPPLDERCRRQLASAENAMLAEMRAFMQQAVEKLSTPWNVGQPGGPFTPEGLAAHQAAVTAGKAFVEFLLERPGSDPQLVQTKFGEFLKTVRETDPAAYDQAIARLRAMPSPYDAGCYAQLQPAIQQNRTKLQPIVDLLEALWAKMETPA
jgi:hypothetical protein